MKNLILISNIDIINKIFTLVTNKLSINLKVYTDTSSLSNADIIVVDEEYKNEDIIEYKMNTNCLILLTQENIDVEDTQFDFILKKPFLPSQLQALLENTNKITNVQEEQQEEEIVEESSDSIEDLISFVSDMTDDDEPEIIDEYAEFIENEKYIEDEEDEENDNDITIRKEDLGHGGVLDQDELSKLYDLVSDEEEINDNPIKKSMNDDNWIDLSNIIDKAIDDIIDYEFDSEKPIKLTLSKYSMTELSLLFSKLDQNIIDNLIDGKEIFLQLRLEK